MRKYLFILLILILPTIYSLFRPGFFSMYDDMQVIRVQQMYECIKDLQIPCRWVPELGYGYGYPLYQFYAPLPYYYMALFSFFGFSFIASVKIGFITSVLLSAFFFFVFARKFVKNFNLSILGSVLYVYAPIRAADLYVRGGMGQLWGLAFIPLIFFGVEKVIKNEKYSSVFFGVSIFLFLISHNLTVFMVFPFLLFWALARLSSISRKEKIESVQKFAAGSVLGVMLSSFYLLPLAIEAKLVHIETLTQGYFNYLAHFASIRQLLFSFHWGYGPSVLGPNDDVSLSAGTIMFLLFIGGMILTIAYAKTNRKFLKETLVLVFFYVLSLFLSHERSTFIWKSIPTLSFLQFPWRYLVLSSFVAPVFIILSMSKLKEKFILYFTAVLVLLTIFAYSGYFRPKDWFQITDSEKLTGANYERQLTASIYDYLPKSAEKAPDAKAPDGPIVDTNEVLVLSKEKGTDWFEYEVDVFVANAEITIPVYDFPNWEVFVDDVKVEHKVTKPLGLLNISVDSGNYQIIAKLGKTPARALGDGMFIAGLILMGIMVNGEKRKNDKK